MSGEPVEDWPDDYLDEPDYLDDPEYPDELDDLDGELAELTDADLVELYEGPRDPLAGYARPVNSPRRPSCRGRTVTDLPAL